MLPFRAEGAVLKGLAAGVLRRWTALGHDCGYAKCIRRAGSWMPSRYFRRGIWLEQTWYCGAFCFEAAAAERFARLESSRTPRGETRHRVPLGLLMVARGQLTYEQLKTALRTQLSAGYGRIGDWFEELGYCNEKQVTSALSAQWACPLLSSRYQTWDATDLVPLALEESFQVVPVHLNRTVGALCLGFADRVDHTLLYTVERMLGLHAEPCLVMRGNWAAAIAEARAAVRPSELAFESPTEIRERAAIVCAYAARTGARRVRLAAAGDHLWVRLQHPAGSLDLLFRLAPEAGGGSPADAG